MAIAVRIERRWDGAGETARRSALATVGKVLNAPSAPRLGVDVLRRPVVPHPRERVEPGVRRPTKTSARTGGHRFVTQAVGELLDRLGPAHEERVDGSVILRWPKDGPAPD